MHASPTPTVSTFSLQLTAQLCHALNREYCRTLGDYSQPLWEDAPDWQRESALNGVRLHFRKLSEGGHPDPRQSHEYWLRQKRAEGWVYGRVKDPEAKTHPCMLEYEQLPADQRVKDYLFVGVVTAMWEAQQAIGAIDKAVAE